MSSKHYGEDPASGRTSSARRRAAFAGSQKPAGGGGKSLVFLVIPILLAVTAIAVIFALQQGSQPASAQAAVSQPGQIGYPVGISSSAPNKRYPAIEPDANGEFRLPVSAFADGKARFFSTKLSDGRAINFFVVRSSDGIIRAALDACDVCYGARKGYYQDGDTMVCNNCGQRFATAKINEVKGGCNPAPLTRSIQGDTVVIKLADLQKDNRAENGQALF